MASSDVFPPRNLPGVAENWGRAIEKRLKSTERDIEKSSQTAGNNNRAFNGSIAVIGSQVVDIRDKLENAQDEIDKARKELDEKLDAVVPVIWSEDDPSGWQVKDSRWYKISGEEILGMWVQVSDVAPAVWEPRELSGNAVVSLDVNKLRASTAELDEAVVEKFWAETVVAKFLTATERIITQDVIATGAVTAAALDADAITGKVIRGGLIEAPRIVSKEGTGDAGNILADPNFTSANDTSWVASGFLGHGDATWNNTVNNTWTGSLTGLSSSVGQSTITATIQNQISAKPRRPGTLLFPNTSSVNKTAYAVNTAPTGTAHSNDIAISSQGISRHPSLNSRATTATSTTTYLTNSASISFVANTPWVLFLQLAMPEDSIQVAAEIADIFVEFVDTTSGAVRATIPYSDELIRSNSPLSQVFTPSFTATCRMRIRSTYTNGGFDYRRFVTTGTQRRRLRLSSQTSWYEDTATNLAGYSVTNSQQANAWSNQTSPSPRAHPQSISIQMPDVIAFGARIEAVKATLSPAGIEAGWTLDPQTGLSLYDESGILTGRINGSENYLSGELSTGAGSEHIRIAPSLWEGNPAILFESGRYASVQSPFISSYVGLPGQEENMGNMIVQSAMPSTGSWSGLNLQMSGNWGIGGALSSGARSRTVYSDSVGVYARGTLAGDAGVRLDRDTGWISLTYASGFSAGTAGQLAYRVIGNLVLIRGGATGAFTSGEYTTVTTAGAIPAAYRPTGSHQRTGAMGTGMRSGGMQVSTTGSIDLGFNYSSPSAPGWLQATFCYAIG